LWTQKLSYLKLKNKSQDAELLVEERERASISGTISPREGRGNSQTMPIAPPPISFGTLKSQRRFDFPANERKHCSCLVVDREEASGSLIRGGMRTFGFCEVVGVLDHYAGLKKFSDRRFTHVLFDARDSEVPAQEFLCKVLEISEDIVMIPTSYNPTI
jgi:hypothetical protein